MISPSTPAEFELLDRLREPLKRIGLVRSGNAVEVGVAHPNWRGGVTGFQLGSR